MDSWVGVIYYEKDVIIMYLVLLITWLGGRFELNCPIAFLKILKLPE